MSAPPRLSDLKGSALRRALLDRHEANKAVWRRKVDEARRPLGERIARAVRAMVRR